MISQLTDNMVAAHEVALRHHYAFGTTACMDHERMRRPDADTWPLFLSSIRAQRRGNGVDGLSRYDLTKYNPWYFGRLREFAELAAKRTRAHHEMYFQHNILEAGAHWSIPVAPIIISTARVSRSRSLSRGIR